MEHNKPTILVIFGVSGDLSKRYLLPAIEQLKKENKLPQQFALVGITRQDNPDFFQMDLENKAEYERLNEHLLALEKSFSAPAQRLFYLSVPAHASESIIECIGKSSLIQSGKDTLQIKIILEKPFGSDLQSAKDFMAHIHKHFTEEQIYRVDHYMLKDGAQEMLTSRRTDPLLKDKWSKEYIESIEIIISESIGIEGRVNFYEQTGALRDILQNHLLELAALTLVELPKLPQDSKDIPIAREKALKSLSIVCDVAKTDCVLRGQYEGYREEVKNPKSMTETFVSVNLQSNNPRWAGVPITLATGKALKEKFTAINVRFKGPARNASSIAGAGGDKNVHNLFNKNSNTDAYKHVFMNIIHSSKDFFVSSGEILETWRILDPVQKLWKDSKDILTYKKGSTAEEVLG